ncbi:MAG: ATP-binding protein, partial [Cyanobacteriota bacterium]
MNKKLVIVDDEEMVISSIKNFLMLETDYEVLSFTSPIKALKELEKSPVSLAISDFLMPEMDGIDFLKAVKDLYSQATLILLTGYADKENAIKAINDLGIYKYIEKPWDNEDLKITIDNAFERTDLIISLEQKIYELNKAQDELRKYNIQLESIVEERTKELIFANAELNTTIESSPDGILTLNESLYILSFNCAIEKLKGCKKNSIINKPLSSIIALNKLKEIDFSSLNEPFLDSNCLMYNEKIHKYIPVEIIVAPIITEQKDITNNYVVAVRDVTAQKETERLRSDFIATLTHDLRTPLQAAIQTLDFFLDRTLGDLNEKQLKYLYTMRASNKDMLGLVNSLLEVYKFESGELLLFKDLFDVTELINNTIEEVTSLISKKNLNLELNFPEKNIKLFADKKEIRRVLANFIGNAINYTPANGKISINNYSDKKTVSITITDTGRGIPQKDQEKLFQRFSQGTSKQRSTGTGLGLYLSRQIIEAHDGKIWVESKEG